MVPNGWLKHKFYEIVKDTQLGTTERHKGDICNNPIPLLKMGNLTWGGFNLNSVELLPREKLDSTLLLKKGDFLFNTRNTPELVGKSAVWNSELPEAVFDNNINRITFKNGIDPFYIVAYLNNGRGKAIINSLPAGSTSVAAIYWKDLKNVQITIPPPPEQRKIAKILSTWDQAIATTERLIATSQQQKKALMQQLLTGKKRLVNPETGISFSGEWHHAELNALLDYMQPTPYLVDSTDYDDSYSTPVLTAGKSFILGYTNEEHGIYREKLPVIIFDDFTTDSKFVDFAFKAKSSAMKILSARKGVSIKYVFEAMNMINFKIGGHQRHWISIFSNLVIPVPNIDEQQKIASVLTAADQEIELLEAKLAHLKDEKKALMQQLLTGKRRVNVDAAEVA